MQLDPAEIFRIVASDEPAELRTYIATPEEGQPLAFGTTAPLLVPRYRLNSEVLLPESAGGTAPIDLIGVYVTLREYLPEPVASYYTPELIVSSYTKREPLRALLGDLALMDHLADQPQVMNELVSEHAARLPDDIGERFLNVMQAGDGTPKILFSRQVVLGAMRRTILATEEEGEADEYLGFSMALTLVHALADTLYHHDSAEGEVQRIGGVPVRLAMEIMQNEIFYRADDVLSLIDRHVRLWRDYGDRTKVYRPRLGACDLLTDATGLNLEDLLALGFAFYASKSTWKTGKPLWVSKRFPTALSDETLDRFYALVSASVEELRASLQSGASDWDLLAFQERPLLELDDELLVLDETLLIDRVLSGLFWFVHDHERDEHGDKARQSWTQVHGEMLELMVEDQLSGLAPVMLDGSSTFYVEEDLAQAYSGKSCDVIIDFGGGMVLFEIVSGQVTTAMRIRGEVDAYEADTEKLVMKKARQLDDTCRSLLDDERPLTGFSAPAGRRMFPVIVNVGTYPVNPLTVLDIEAKIEAEGLLGDGRIESLAIVDLGELEMLEALSSGLTPPEILKAWKESTLPRVALRNYLLTTYSGRPASFFRPARMTERTNAVFEDMTARLELAEGASDVSQED